MPREYHGGRTHTSAPGKWSFSNDRSQDSNSDLALQPPLSVFHKKTSKRWPPLSSNSTVCPHLSLDGWQTVLEDYRGSLIILKIHSAEAMVYMGRIFKLLKWAIIIILTENQIFNRKSMFIGKKLLLMLQVSLDYVSKYCFYVENYELFILPKIYKLLWRFTIILTLNKPYMIN